MLPFRLLIPAHLRLGETPAHTHLTVLANLYGLRYPHYLYDMRWMLGKLTGTRGYTWMLSRHLAIPSSTHWSIWLTSRPVSSRCLRKAEFQLDRHRKMVVLLRWSLGARCRLRYSSSSVHFATTSATPDRTLVEVMPEWFWLLISSGTKNATNLHGQSRSCAWAPLLG